MITTGNLDPADPEDEVVVAAPELNFVAVIYKVADCFGATSCDTVLEIPLPDGANIFGAAMLIADVDDDSKPELVIGAPDSDSGTGALFVYDFESKSFTDKKVPDPRAIKPASGAAVSFGASLAHGKFDGLATGKSFLAVGAPSTDVEGTAKAGKILLYDAQLSDNPEEVFLINPPDRGLLGRSLTSLPFRVDGEDHDVLVAGAQTAVYAFFSPR